MRDRERESSTTASIKMFIYVTWEKKNFYETQATIIFEGGKINLKAV